MSQVACDDKPKTGENAPDIVEGAGDAEPTKLDSAQERRITDMDKSGPLLNPGLAEALIGLPKDHAERVIKLTYPKAVVGKNNPRVNTLFKIKGAGALKTLDVRWSRMDKALIGSVVFTYGTGIDVATLGGLVKAAAKPIEGENEQWAVEGGRLRLAFYPRNMDGETVVAFEPFDLEGDAIGESVDGPKKADDWELKGRQREQILKAGTRRSDENASGRGRDEDSDQAAAPAPEAERAPKAAAKPATKEPPSDGKDSLDALDDL
jgi:hypothetical protein